jgi:predicted nucleic-acid-binding protein
MPIVDTNVILRYVLDDNEELSLLARDIIDRGEVEVSLEVLAEAVYVLKSVYNVPRDEISAQLIDFVRTSEIELEQGPVALRALEIFGTENMGFIDSVLAARALVMDAQVTTFDAKLRNYIDKEQDKAFRGFSSG